MKKEEFVPVFNFATEVVRCKHLRVKMNRGRKMSELVDNVWRETSREIIKRAGVAAELEGFDSQFCHPNLRRKLEAKLEALSKAEKSALEEQQTA